MQGTEKPDRELLDALGLCGALVREGSVHRFLAEHRLRLFGDGLFADLFGGRGRPSVPGSVIAVVMVLQALEGCSDREAVERLRCDVRWKAAAGLGIDDEGFDASVLTLWRQRLRASERPERIFDAVREVAAECGALSKRTRRALDSTVLYDAVATQDTVTMIGAQIRRVRRLAPQAAAVALGHDYDGRAKPVCDWGDPDERGWLIDDLVTRRPKGARRARRLRAQRRAGPGGGAARGGGRPRRRGRPQGAGTLAHSAPCREGPGHIDSGPRGPPRPQVPLAAPRRLQGPHLRRARHRAHHRGRAHHSGHVRRPSRTPPAPTRPHSPPQHRRHRRHHR